MRMSKYSFELPYVYLEAAILECLADALLQVHEFAAYFHLSCAVVCIFPVSTWGHAKNTGSVRVSDVVIAAPRDRYDRKLPNDL